MNYIRLINAFWEVKREREDFTAQVHSLYFAILFYANRNEWKPFSLYREDLTTLAEISNNSYYSAREILKAAGLISFVEGKNKKTKCSYTVLSVYQIKDTKRTSEGHNKDTGKDTERTPADTILDKPINLKTSKPINKSVGASLPAITSENKSPDLFSDLTAEPEKPKEKSSAQKEKVIDFGKFDTPEFKVKWWEYKNYRASIRPKPKNFASIESEQRAFNKLLAYDMDFAIELINAAIDNGWQGLVWDQTPQKYQAYLAAKNKTNPSTQTRPSNDAYRVERNVA